MTQGVIYNVDVLKSCILRLFRGYESRVAEFARILHKLLLAAHTIKAT